MRKYIWAMIVMIAMSSCYHVNEEQVKIPNKLLSEKELAEIITEMQITESGFIVANKMKIRKSEKPRYYKAILEKYDVTLDDIRDNMIYYHSQPKVMQGIYETSLENLSKLQNEIEEDIKRQKAFEDSLKLINDSIANTIDSINDSSEFVKEKSILLKGKTTSN
jgi:hypothetical protein